MNFINVSRSVFGAEDPKNLFAYEASVVTMNKARIKDRKIRKGDYIVGRKYGTSEKPKNGDLIFVSFNESTTLRAYHEEEDMVILYPQTSLDVPPIFIAKCDMKGLAIIGQAIKILPSPN